ESFRPVGAQWLLGPGRTCMVHPKGLRPWLLTVTPPGFVFTRSGKAIVQPKGSRPWLLTITPSGFVFTLRGLHSTSGFVCLHCNLVTRPSRVPDPMLAPERAGSERNPGLEHCWNLEGFLICLI